MSVSLEKAMSMQSFRNQVKILEQKKHGYLRTIKKGFKITMKQLSGEKRCLGVLKKIAFVSSGTLLTLACIYNAGVSVYSSYLAHKETVDERWDSSIFGHWAEWSIIQTGTYFGLSALYFSFLYLKGDFETSREKASGILLSVQENFKEPFLKASHKILFQKANFFLFPTEKFSSTFLQLKTQNFQPDLVEVVDSDRSESVSANEVALEIDSKK